MGMLRCPTCLALLEGGEARCPACRTRLRKRSQPIVLGEKENASRHFYMDFLESAAGNDFEELDHAKHSSGAKGSGGSNYAFLDGSVRFLRQGQSVSPENLWAVTDKWRKNAFTPQ